MAAALFEPLTDAFSTFLDAISFRYWRWRVVSTATRVAKQQLASHVNRNVGAALAFLLLAYALVGPARLASGRGAAAARAAPSLALHVATGMLLLGVSALAVGYSSGGDPRAFGFGAAGAAALFLSLQHQGEHGVRRALLRPLPLLAVLAAAAADGLRLPLAAAALRVRVDGLAGLETARRMIATAFRPPDAAAADLSSYPALQLVSGPTWVALAMLLPLLAVLLLPLRFRCGFLGGPFVRRGGHGLGWTGLTSSAAIGAAMVLLHVAAGSTTQSALLDVDMDKRRVVAVAQLYACAGYATAAVLLVLRELALESLRLHSASSLRAAHIDLYALVVLAALAATVLFRSAGSLTDENSRLFRARALSTAWLKQFSSRLATEAFGFHATLFGGERRVRPGDGFVGAAIAAAYFAELLVDALERSSLVLAPLLADVAARGSPRAKALALTVDIDEGDEAVAELGELLAVLAGSGPADAIAATFFLSPAALRAQGAPALRRLRTDGHEVALLWAGEGEAGLRAALADADAALGAHAHSAVQWVRPAGGARSAHSLRAAAHCGLGVALWSSSVDLGTRAGGDGTMRTMPRQLGLGLRLGADAGALDPTVVRGAVVRVERASASGLAAVVALLREASVAVKSGGPVAFATMSAVCPDGGREQGEVLPVA